MKTNQTLTVKLTLVGPILTTGGEMCDPGIDAPMARDRYGRFMLPFSLIKGKVLDALRDLGETNQLSQWLGKENDDGLYEPERGNLWFSDFYTKAEGKPDNIIERIQIDADSGTAAHGMLMMLQAPFGYGEEVTFVGKIDFVADEAEATRIKTEITQALRWVPAYGANRTVGFGRTKKVTSELDKTKPRSNGTPLGADVVPIQLKLDRPLCIVGRKHSNNHFESLETISGTILKGAIARMLQERIGEKNRDVSSTQGGDYAQLRKHFTSIRFSEARPIKVCDAVEKMRRPIEPPLSIVTCPTEVNQGLFFDAALEEQPTLIDRAAPCFAPDWKVKDFATVRGAFGWPQLPRERRTRTAINADTGRAFDEQLFSYGLVLPDKKDASGSESFVWEGDIGLEAIPENDQGTVRGELQKLLQYGITGIGKTRANGEVKWLEEPTQTAISSDFPVGDETVIVTLQTECLMTNPGTLQAGGADPLRAAYAEFWNEISEASLTLDTFFARQALYGGYVSKRANSGKYEPFLLTERGSVFVLKANAGKDSQEFLNAWNKKGLPLAAWVKPRYAAGETPLWQRCPYIPENGYGAISIDLNCHRKNRFSTAKSTGAST